MRTLNWVMFLGQRSLPLTCRGRYRLEHKKSCRSSCTLWIVSSEVSPPRVAIPLTPSSKSRSAFVALCRRGIHPAWRNLGSGFPIKNQKLMSKLQRTLSALSYWSPVFAQLAYLPGLVFPFVKLFASMS